MKKNVLIIMCIIIFLSGCKSNYTQNTSSIFTKKSSSSSSNNVNLTESESGITEKLFLNAYYDQLFDTSSYSEWSLEETNKFLVNAINKDLWYHGKYSEFYFLLGKSWNYVCRTDTSTASMYYINYLLKLSDGLNSYSSNEYFFIQLIPTTHFSEEFILKAKKNKINSANDLLNLINTEMNSVLFNQWGVIKISEPKKPIYASTDKKNNELKKIRKKIKTKLDALGEKGYFQIYVRDFVSADISFHNQTDVFIVDSQNNVFLAEYVADYYQSVLSDDEVGDIGDFVQIKSDDVEKQYYFNKVKENNADKFDITIL